MGVFNLILDAKDKNNRNLKRRTMGKLRRTVDDLLLNDIALNGRAFTWTNDKRNSTLTMIDQVLGPVEWRTFFPGCFLKGISSAIYSLQFLRMHTLQFPSPLDQERWFPRGREPSLESYCQRILLPN
jgi:hypothetical protein